MNEQHKCSRKISKDGHSYQCSKTGKLEHEGRFYCGLHHPPTVIAKRKARDAAWTEKFDAEYKARKIAEAERLEEKRRASLFPDLLAALQRLIATDDAHATIHAEDEDDVARMLEYAAAFDNARAAIARALPQGAPE